MRVLDIALLEYGKEYWEGIPSNSEILKYFHETGHTYIHDDETPWCAAFMNWVCKQAGIKTQNKLNARSFLEVGKAVAPGNLGDIVVLWREDPKSWKGHVGIYIREEKHIIYVLGGNQDGRVCIKPFRKEQILSFRKIED